jgi:L-aminopeptidase/D-esterase-like protein
MRYLEEKGIGFDARVARVPIVPAAILYDLAVGDPQSRPDAPMGYAACLAASDGPIAEGTVGAGTGATAGKVLGPKRAMKAGLGSAAVRLSSGLIVGALVAANPFGHIVNPQTGAILVGAREQNSDHPADTLVLMDRLPNNPLERLAPNTVIGVVATNARLNKEEINKVAQMAQNGIAQTVRPAHTMFDGDTLFALTTGQLRADTSLVGAYAAQVVAEAVVRAVQKAKGADGLPAWRDLHAAD